MKYNYNTIDIDTVYKFNKTLPVYTQTISLIDYKNNYLYYKIVCTCFRSVVGVSLRETLAEEGS